MRRLYERGNTLLGGMLLLSLLSAAAIALDARGMKFVPAAQMASPTAATGKLAVGEAPIAPVTTAQKASVSKAFNCEPGVNYEIVPNKEKVQVKCTYGAFTCNPSATTYPGCDGIIQASTPNPIPLGTAAQCKKPGGEPSTVRLCLPEELIQSGKQSCIERKCAAGQVLNAKDEVGKPDYKQLFSTSVDEAFRSGDGELRDAAIENVQALDDRTAKSIVDSWGESFDDTVAARKVELVTAEKSLQELQEGLDRCAGDCAKYEQELVAAKQYRDSLQKQVAGLDQFAARLEPTTQTEPGKSQTAVDAASKQAADYKYFQPKDTFAGAADREATSRAALEQACLKGNSQACLALAGNNSQRPGGQMGGQPFGQGGGRSQQSGGQQQQCSSMGSFFGTCQQQPQPSCAITANPTRVATPVQGQQQQPVTLTWQAQNAHSANLSAVGAVGPYGSLQVNPQQTTTYSLQVVANSNNSNYSNNNGYSSPVYGQCSVTVTVGDATRPQDQTPTAPTPVAQISCQPQVAEVGMRVAISYSCQNATQSTGTNFSTNGALSGSAIESVATSSSASAQVYGIRCTNQNISHVAQCSVQINKSSIVLVANPSTVKRGEETTLGWVTGGVESCVISSPTH